LRKKDREGIEHYKGISMYSYYKEYPKIKEIKMEREEKKK
jgi:hypothetical protein